MSRVATDFDGVLFFWEKGQVLPLSPPLPFMFLTASQRFRSGRLGEDSLNGIWNHFYILKVMQFFKKYDY